MAVFDAPRGTSPYGIASTPDGQVFFASLAGSYLGQIDYGVTPMCAEARSARWTASARRRIAGDVIRRLRRLFHQ
jgi:streptogramin lyase